MQRIENLTRPQLEEIARSVQGLLYRDLDGPREWFNPDKVWHGADICQALAGLLATHGLAPEGPLSSETSRESDEAAQVSAPCDRLLRFAEALGIQPGQLDDLVHDAASERASAVNNSGVEEQIRFLVEQWGIASTGTHLETLTTASGETSDRRLDDR